MPSTFPSYRASLIYKDSRISYSRRFVWHVKIGTNSFYPVVLSRFYASSTFITGSREVKSFNFSLSPIATGTMKTSKAVTRRSIPWLQTSTQHPNANWKLLISYKILPGQGTCHSRLSLPFTVMCILMQMTTTCKIWYLRAWSFCASCAVSWRPPKFNGQNIYVAQT